MLVLFVIPTYSFATNWTFVTGIETNNTKIDLSSIERSGDLVTFWTVQNFSPKDRYGNSSYKSQSMINCRSSELAAIQLNTFTNMDALGTQNYSQKAPTAQWVSIPKDSVGAKLLTYVCQS